MNVRMPSMDRRSLAIPDHVSAVGALRVPSHLVAVLGILALTVIGTRALWRGGTMVGTDAITFAYPMYAALGERLRAGDIPGWSPSQFGGAPFAADPESGWMYLPAMALFSALPLDVAINAYLMLHFAVAGLGTYALARVLGMNLGGALVAAVAYEFSGFFFAFSLNVPAFIQVATWMPALVLGAELAVRSTTPRARACWWGMTGLVLSQILAAWIGQGAYYACLVLGTYLAYRTLLDPPVASSGHGARVRSLALHGGGILLFAAGLSAVSVLPRIEFYLVSNLAGGYQGWAAEVGAFTWRSLPGVVLARAGNMFFAGSIAVALALYALYVARGRFAAPYFLALSAATLVLATQHTTPLHLVLYGLLPEFEEFHRHFPERIMMVFYLGPALLAGAAVSSLRNQKALLQIALLSAVFLDLMLGSFGALAVSGHRVDTAAYFDAPGAASFLRARQAAQPDQPFRYFGYDPGLHTTEHGQPIYYRYNWPDSTTRALVGNNLATPLGLQDIQGYNPIQVDRFVEYMAALNGRAQEYHGSYVLPEGLGSPLLDLLGARYVVVPAATPPDRPDLLGLADRFPTVYQDARVKVLENPEALPRAWIVHEAQRVGRGEALPLLATGAIDPRRTALLEDDAPPLAQPADIAADLAVVLAAEPDRVRVRTSTDAPGLLVLGEIAYPAWRAYVDGEPVRLHVADHALRAVPVPAGDHTVELRFESSALTVGAGVSLTAHATLLALVAATVWRRRGPTRPAPFGEARAATNLGRPVRLPGFGLAHRSGRNQRRRCGSVAGGDEAAVLVGIEPRGERPPDAGTQLAVGGSGREPGAISG